MPILKEILEKDPGKDDATSGIFPHTKMELTVEEKMTEPGNVDDRKYVTVRMLQTSNRRTKLQP